MIETRPYAEGTELTVKMPWSLYVSGKALCSDGKVRKLKRIAETPSDAFSIPAAVVVSGKTVSGYITFVENTYNQRTVVFHALENKKNWKLLP